MVCRGQPIRRGPSAIGGGSTPCLRHLDMVALQTPSSPASWSTLIISDWFIGRLRVNCWYLGIIGVNHELGTCNSGDNYVQSQRWLVGIVVVRSIVLLAIDT